MQTHLGRVRTFDRVKMMIVMIMMIPIVVTLVGIVTDVSAVQ